MTDLKNKPQDLYSLTDTDLLIEMSWKDDPASRSEAAFTVFKERYENLIWPVVYQVCRNYVPHHGKQLPMEVFNNTFMMVYEQPLLHISHFETFSCPVQLGSEVELWLSQLADKALRELMNGGREENRKRNIRVGVFYVSQADDDGPRLLEETTFYYDNAKNAKQDENPDKEDAQESELQAHDGQEDEDVIDAVSVEGELMVDALADDSYLPDAALDQEAEEEQGRFTEEQRDKVRQAIEQLPPRDKEIVITVMTYEARGHYTPRPVLENLRVQYGTTSENIRAILSRFRKKLRQLMQVDIQRRI